MNPYDLVKLCTVCHQLVAGSDWWECCEMCRLPVHVEYRGVSCVSRWRYYTVDAPLCWDCDHDET